MITHGVSHSSVYKSVWSVVDAVNSTEELAIKFPSDHASQKKISRGFKQKSEVGFDCCVGAIDGMLVWISKPNKSDCDWIEIGPGKFYCGRKKKYGLVLQAICDSNRRFLDVYV